MDDLKKMLGKKDKNQNSDKKEAKLNALKSLRNEMSNLMQDGLKGNLSKVTVASSNKEGLEKGLEKAKEMLEQAPESSEELENEESSEKSEETEKETSELEEEICSMEEEQLDELMKKISERKKELMLNK